MGARLLVQIVTDNHYYWNSGFLIPGIPKYFSYWSLVCSKREAEAQFIGPGFIGHGIGGHGLGGHGLGGYGFGGHGSNKRSADAKLQFGLWFIYWIWKTPKEGLEDI